MARPCLYTNENLLYVKQLFAFTYNNNKFKWTLDFNHRVQEYRIQHRIRIYDGTYKEDIGNNFYNKDFDTVLNKFDNLKEKLLNE